MDSSRPRGPRELQQDRDRPAAFDLVGTRTQTLSILGSTDGSTFSTIVGSAGYTFDPSTGNTVTITFRPRAPGTCA